MATINKLYKTQIDCSKYNVGIDTEDTIVTVKLIDFNNQPVTNTNVTITCDKGLFTQVVDENATFATQPNTSSNLSVKIDQSFIVSFTKDSDGDRFSYSLNNPHHNQSLTGTITTKDNNNGQINTTPLNLAVSDGALSYVNGQYIHTPWYEFSIGISDATILNFSLSLQPYEDNNTGVFYKGYNYQTMGEIINPTTSYTGTTDNNGMIRLLYKATDWGFATLQANNSNIKMRISGWRNAPARLGFEYTTTHEINQIVMQGSPYYTDPFPFRNIKYDDSIGVAIFFLGYQSKWAANSNEDTTSGGYYKFNQSGVTTLASFLKNSTNSDSRLPDYIFPSYKLNHWYRPDILFYITDAGAINIRAYNELGETVAPSNTYSTGILWIRDERVYVKSENIING